MTAWEPETLVEFRTLTECSTDLVSVLDESRTILYQSPGTATERVEHRFEHGDSSWMWIESIASNRTDTAIGGYVVNSRDITERKKRSSVWNSRTNNWTSSRASSPTTSAIR